MIRSDRLRTLALLLALSGGRALAEDPPSGGEPPAEAPVPETPTLRVPTDEEVATLLEELKGAAKRKKASEVLPTLEKFAGLTHPDFLKPLTKMLTHEAGEVAVRAARILESQSPVDVDPKVQEKNAKDLWKSGWAHASNDKRYLVKGAAVRAIGAWGCVLDDRQYDEVERMWRSQLGNPAPERVDALLDVIAYFEKTKDKRFCRHLAEQIDEPIASSPNSPSNPPASWWEARWKTWDKLKGAVNSALKAITGQDFKATADAKKWFEENEKAFGFKW
jgi:hypothetical protein